MTSHSSSPAGNDADVIIIGAGLIGCTIARLLGSRGADVIVVDRDTPGQGATWAAGGMLSPLIESENEDPFFRLADRSFDLYAPLVEAVQRESGMSVDYRAFGKLQCALDDTDAQSLVRLSNNARAAQYGLHLMDGDEARRFEPGLSLQVTSALFVERDHCVDNRLFARAMELSAKACGARIDVGMPVTAVECDGGRATGVRLASGDRVNAPSVVVAAGAWSASLEGLPQPLPVTPVRGQMLAVDMRSDARRTTNAAGNNLTMFDRMVGTEHCYMIPRSNGRLVIGATVEHVDFERGPTPDGIAWLIGAARTVMPAIASLPILETWAGFRPGTPDDWPIIGADPSIDGLTYATGHYRNGILLAPVTAEAVASIIDGDSPDWIEPFGIERFIRR